MSAAESTSQAIQARTPAKTLSDYLSSPAAKSELANAARSFMKPEDLIRLALMAASRQPELFQCTARSILRALMDSAAVGIAPGGTMGRGWLVPRKNKKTNELEATFDPGWRGLADIAKRSGVVKRIDAKVVYQGDIFEYEEGTNQRLRHVPDLELVDDDDELPRLIVCAYAIASFDNGEKQIEVLRKSDIERIRAVSMASAGPWGSWYDEMARKSAVRRLCKYLPYDPLLERALEHATDVESGVRTVIDMTPPDRQIATPEDLEAKLRAEPPAITAKPQTVSTATPAQAAPVAAPAPQRAPRGSRKPEPEPPFGGPPSTPPAAQAPAPTVNAPPAAPVAKWPDNSTAAPAPARTPDPREVACAICGKPVVHGVSTWKDGKQGTRHAACSPLGASTEPAEPEPPPGFFDDEPGRP